VVDLCILLRLIYVLIINLQSQSVAVAIGSKTRTGLVNMPAREIVEMIPVNIVRAMVAARNAELRKLREYFECDCQEKCRVERAQGKNAPHGSKPGYMYVCLCLNASGEFTGCFSWYVWTNPHTQGEGHVVFPATVQEAVGSDFMDVYAMADIDCEAHTTFVCVAREYSPAVAQGFLPEDVFSGFEFKCTQPSKVKKGSHKRLKGGKAVYQKLFGESAAPYGGEVPLETRDGDLCCPEHLFYKVAKSK